MKNLKILKIHILHNYQINLRERKFAILIKIVQYFLLFEKFQIFPIYNICKKLVNFP